MAFNRHYMETILDYLNGRIARMEVAEALVINNRDHSPSAVTREYARRNHIAIKLALSELRLAKVHVLAYQWVGDDLIDRYKDFKRAFVETVEPPY